MITVWVKLLFHTVEENFLQELDFGRHRRQACGVSLDPKEFMKARIQFGFVRFLKDYSDAAASGILG